MDAPLRIDEASSYLVRERSNEFSASLNCATGDSVDLACRVYPFKVNLFIPH